MWIYAVVLTTVGLIALLSLSLPKGHALRSVLLAVTFLVLVLFIGLRDRVGGDWDPYQAIFDSYAHVELRNVFITVPVEPGYALVNYISSLLGGGIYLVNSVCAGLMIAALAKFADLVDADPVFTLFLAMPYLVFTVGMGYTRQAVAIGLGCAALGYWVRGDRRKFFLITLIAIGFHYSALFLFFVVWARSWRRLVIAIPLAVAVGYVFIIQFYTHYFDLYVQNTADMYSSGVWFRLAIVLSGVVLVIFQKSRWRDEPRLFGLIVSGSVIALCLVPAAVVASTLADRVCLYLFFIYLVTFARSLRFSPVGLRYSALAVAYVTTYACFLLWFALSSYAVNFWIPYHNALVSGTGTR
jgi:hypothetical protein